MHSRGMDLGRAGIHGLKGKRFVWIARIFLIIKKRKNLGHLDGLVG